MRTNFRNSKTAGKRQNEEALKERNHRRALAFLEAAHQQRSNPTIASGSVGAFGSSLGNQQIAPSGAGLRPGQVSNDGFRRNESVRMRNAAIDAPATIASAANSVSLDGAENNDEPGPFASPGETNHDYLGSGHAKMNRRNAVNVPKGYLEVEITVSPLGRNLGFGKILPGIGKRIPKASQPGAQIEVIERGGRTIVDEVIQMDPGEVQTIKPEIDPKVAYTVLISPIGSAVWDYTVYANTFFSDLPAS